MTDKRWPFGDDATREHPLTALRIAVTSSHPRWRYLVAFDRKSTAEPTDAEAAMLASYLDGYKTHWYNPGYLAKMAALDLDVDGGANGVIFHKYGPDDWGYRRQSHVQGWMFSVIPPGCREKYPEEARGAPYSLERLMDRMQAHGVDRPNKTWLAWKAEHPEVFSTDT